MIDRYTNKALEGLFSDESRFQAYWEIELAVLEAYAKDYELIKSKAKVDVKRIKEIEEITRHDVVAFTRQVGEGLGEEKTTPRCRFYIRRLTRSSSNTSILCLRPSKPKQSNIKTHHASVEPTACTGRLSPSVSSGLTTMPNSFAGRKDSKKRPTCYVLASFLGRWATSPTSIRKFRKWSPLNLV